MQLFEGNNTDFTTANTDTYRGWDTSKHRRAAPAKISEPDYKPPVEKFENLTTTRSHFQPIKEHINYKPVKIMPVPKTEINNRKFDYRTTQSMEFKPYSINPMDRPKNYKIVDVYIPTAEKFDGTTTTKANFKNFANTDKMSPWKPPTQDHRSREPFIDDTEYRKSFFEKKVEPWPPTEFVQEYLRYHQPKDKNTVPEE